MDIAAEGLSRRAMLAAVSTGLAGLAAACSPAAAPLAAPESSPAPAGPTPPSTATLAEAERLLGVSYTEAEREQMLADVTGRLAQLEALRAIEKPNTLAPALTFDPRLPGVSYPSGPSVVAMPASAAALPSDPADIAFASVADISGWFSRGLITSRALTDLYLDRIARHAPKLECFVTILADRARAEADAMDAERRAGRVRGPLHGIPYAVKDLFDAEGGPTTWGAEPWKDRVGDGDSAVVRRLAEAGCVLLGKTTCGALAYGDIWFGGVTRNPFNPAEGSSGSSAGSASATAAGLCAFAIGTETLGSLVSPSHRCGTTALRPTFGRISRAGGMALCWSLDKVGPMVRSAADTALVLAALNGADPDDAASLDMPFSFDPRGGVSGLRVGVNAEWMEAGSEGDRAALEVARRLGVTLRPFAPEALPYNILTQQLLAEAAAAFEEMTLSGDDDRLTWQDNAAWPNTFRATRFLSAIDLIQIDRLRRRTMQAMHAAFDGLDVVLGPNFAGGMLTATNFSGHPQLAFLSGFIDSPPRSIFGSVTDAAAAVSRVPVATSLWAPLFREGPMITLAAAIEAELGVARERPAAFS